MQSPQLQAIFDNLVDAIRTELRTEFLDLLGGATPKPARGKPGPKPKAPAALKETKGRRSRADVEQAAHVFTLWLRRNPDTRIETAAKALGVTTKFLFLPVQKLLADKKITKKGRLRGTTYKVKS